MRIYKFGGASVKDASGVKNLVKILNELGNDKTLVVVSAMGKMTNSLEFVVKNYFENQKELEYSLNEIFVFHNNILNELFSENNHPIYSEINVTMVHGQKDEVVPVSYSRKVLKIFQKAKKKLVIIDNGDHSLSSQRWLRIIMKELKLII